MATNRRTHPRTPFRSRVKLMHPDFGEVIVMTRDISDSGIFIFERSGLLSIGDIVEVQIQDTPMEAPVVQMAVVRRDSEGYGLQFVNS